MFGIGLIGGALTSAFHGALIGAISFGTPVIAVALLGAAAFSFVYVPTVGRMLGVALLALSLGALGYDKGFHARANLDRSAEYRAQIEQLKANEREVERQVAAANAVAADATMAQRNADDHAAQLQEQLDAYVAKLSKAATSGCALTDGDVGGLRGIGADPRPDSASVFTRGPSRLRPTHKGPRPL